MIIRNKLDKPFNPSAVAAGYFIFIAGIATAVKGYGILFILLGGFMAFSYTRMEINIHTNKFRMVFNIFGFIPQGRWKSLNNFTQLTIMKSKKIYHSYSRSNRQFTGKILDYRVVAINKTKKTRIPLQKCKTQEEAISAGKELSIQLNIPLINT